MPTPSIKSISPRARVALEVLEVFALVGYVIYLLATPRDIVVALATYLVAGILSERR